VSIHHRKAIVRREYLPHTILWRGLLALCIVGSLILAFYLGRGSQDSALLPYDDGADRLHAQLVELETRLLVDGQTISELREELTLSRGGIDELERELAFYRSVLAPEEQSAGVILRTPVLRSLGVPGLWRYQLVAQQGGQTRSSGKTVYKGELRVTFVGVERGIPQRYTLSELDGQLAADTLNLSFRYFQRREGELALPPGFEPERVELQFAMAKPTSQLIDASFAWEEIRVLSNVDRTNIEVNTNIDRKLSTDQY
jgi:uncharacterized coiled-coil protein SlyX